MKGSIRLIALVVLLVMSGCKTQSTGNEASETLETTEASETPEELVQPPGTVPPGYKFSIWDRAIPVGNYGNWCGAKPTVGIPGTDGPAAIDGLDECCRTHDICYPTPAPNYCMSDVQAHVCNGELVGCVATFNREHCNILGVFSKACRVSKQIEMYFWVNLAANSTCVGGDCCDPKGAAEGVSPPPF